MHICIDIYIYVCMGGGKSSGPAEDFRFPFPAAPSADRPLNSEPLLNSVTPLYYTA
jgi:hypothetical protein